MWECAPRRRGYHSAVLPDLEPRCLDTHQALLLDGANGVCGDARASAGRGHEGHAAALVLGALAIAAWLGAPRLGRRARAGLALAVALAAALPGAYALLARRADRPLARGETARASMALHDELRAFAVVHGCARTGVEACEECMPAARLALAGLRCAAPARIDLRAGALVAGCRQHAGVLVCGRAR